MIHKTSWNYKSDKTNQNTFITIYQASGFASSETNAIFLLIVMWQFM